MKQLISEGINVNVTLLFSTDAYERVAQAYLAGLERREGDLSSIGSVASFFVSRIDVMIDGMLQKEIENMTGTGDEQLAKSLLGKVAIANAKIAYQYYKKMFAGERWDKLKARGAQPQRLLWASTSTKNPEYRDVIYCEELIGPDDGQHHAAFHVRCVPRPRPTAQQPGGKRGCREGGDGQPGEGQHLHDGGDR